MATYKAKYNIKAISNIVGIQPGTLRAWERRYSIIKPLRNDAGHRLYTDEHIAVLRWLLNKVNKGFTIGQAVGLLEKGNVNEELQKKTDDVSQLQHFSSQLQEALLTFREQEANQILDEAFGIFSVEKVMVELISDVLRSIGDKWEKGLVSIAHEHFATQYIRSRIGMVFQTLQIDPLLPKVIAACSPNEKHELGLFIFTLFLRRKGYQVIYVGANIPFEDLNQLVAEVEVKYLFLSCTMAENLTDTFTTIKKLEKDKPDLIIGIGGQAILNASKRISGEDKMDIYNVGTSRDVWEEWLKRTSSKIKW